MPSVTLGNRGLITIDGEDAEDFLHGLVTTDIAGLPRGEWWPGALLTPQGKILYDFLISRHGDGFLIECAGDIRDLLVKRLTMYKLRAKVVLGTMPDTTVTVGWETGAPDGALRDHRFAIAGADLWRLPGSAGKDPVELYEALRNQNAILGGGEDGSLADYFPHDILMDRNGGVSFKKGCYVGQEVVSRMQHRSTARRRPAVVSAETPLPGANTPLLVDGREIGNILRSSGKVGLAIVRIDKAGAALAGGQSITIEGVPLSIRLPAWSGLEFPTDSDDATP